MFWRDTSVAWVAETVGVVLLTGYRPATVKLPHVCYVLEVLLALAKPDGR